MPRDNYKLFLSYEREDSAGWATLLYRELKDRYGDGAVFKDEEETRTGTRWKPRLERLVRDCEIFILVIGPDWSGQRVLDKLKDPDTPVRKEILAALESDRAIFPVLVGGASGPPTASLPGDLRPAIEAVHRFEFKSMRSLDDDLQQLCTDIEATSTLTTTTLSSLPPPTQYDQVICRLDRVHEADCVRQRFTGGGRLFLATGAARAGFRHFAIRCALDSLGESDPVTGAGRTARKETELVVPLNWALFAEPEEADDRRSNLIREIASCLMAESARPGNIDCEARIRDWIRGNPRPTLVYCIAGRGTEALASRVRQWFEIWQALLGRQCARSIAVILFVESGWLPWIGQRWERMDECDCVVRPDLGKVRKQHLEQWFAADLQRSVVDQRLRRKIRDAGGRLFRFRSARHFEDVDDALFPIWTEGDRG